MYTMTYLSTATDMNNLLDSIVKYERERLTNVIEGSMRTQDYARADRTAVSASLSELTTTSVALFMHFEQYQGDEAENPYLQLTPMALRRSMGMLSMVRQATQAEADFYYQLSFADGLDGEDMGNLRNMSSDTMGIDYFLYGKACEMNEACIAHASELLS